MPLLAQPSDVFILRIWREPRALVEQPPLYRGMVEHVPTGVRQYFTTLDQALVFIVRQIEQTDDCQTD